MSNFYIFCFAILFSSVYIELPRYLEANAHLDVQDRELKKLRESDKMLHDNWMKAQAEVC